MNRSTSDPKLRDAIRRLAPGVDTSTFCRDLQERCTQKQQSRYPGRHLRRVAITAAVVVVLAAVSAGLVTGLSYLRDAQSVIVFTDVPTTDVPSLSTTTTIMDVGPRLAWGEEAIFDGRTVKVEQPVEPPGMTVELPPDHTGAPSTYGVAYCMVTITNTGSEPLTCAAQEFFLMGKSSGSSGINFGSEKALAGDEVLDYLVTLQPGESVEAAVCFYLEQGDHPVEVLLGTRDAAGYVHTSTSEWLALWQ